MENGTNQLQFHKVHGKLREIYFSPFSAKLPPIVNTSSGQASIDKLQTILLFNNNLAFVLQRVDLLLTCEVIIFTLSLSHPL